MSLTLLGVYLKSFFRNWKTILLLLVFPVLLILVIFSSFDQTGLGNVPVGIVNSISGIEEMFEIFTFLDLTEYSSLDECLIIMKRRENYGCLEFKDETTIVVTFHYDNTQEPFIYELAQRIEQVILFIQNSLSKEIVGEFLDSTSTSYEETHQIAQDLDVALLDVSQYIQQVTAIRSRVNNAQNDLSNALTQMSRDLQDTRTAVASTQSMYWDASRSISQSISRVENELNFGQIHTLRSQLQSLDSQFSWRINDINNRLDGYEQTRQRGVSYVRELDRIRSDLDATERDLRSYQQSLIEYKAQLLQVQSDLLELSKMDVNMILSPIQVRGIPQYIPLRADSGGDVSQTQISQGLALLNMQVLFPKILLLIVIFLSLLIGSFMTVQSIHSTAKSRLKLLNGIFFAEVIGIFVASILVVFAPITMIVLVGNFIFGINMVRYWVYVLLLLVLLSSFFILVGSITAYALKSESISFLTIAFLLVFFIFFSGFVLPLEHMGHYFSLVASFLPPSVALDALYILLFYTILEIHSHILILLLWCVSLFVITLCVKFIRRG